jgi:lipoyl-dependent peroxiredoxin
MEKLYTAIAYSYESKEMKISFNDDNSLRRTHNHSSFNIMENTKEPEQLFATVYATSFNKALNRAAKRNALKLDTKITANVRLKEEAGIPTLSVEILGNISGVKKAEAKKLMEEAKQLCPYSKAIKENINFKIDVAEPIREYKEQYY